MFQQFATEKKQSGAAKCIPAIYYFLFCKLPHLSTYMGGHAVSWEGDWLSIQKSGMHADQQNLSVNQAFMRSEQREMPLLLLVLTVQFSKYTTVLTTTPCSYALQWRPMTTSAFGLIGIFSDLFAVRYNQKIGSALQTHYPGSENTKSQFCLEWSPLEFLQPSFKPTTGASIVV